MVQNIDIIAAIAGGFTGILFGTLIPQVILRWFSSTLTLVLGGILVISGKLVCSLGHLTVPGVMMGLFGAWLLLLSMGQCCFPPALSWFTFIVGIGTHLMYGIDVIYFDIKMLTLNYLISITVYALAFPILIWMTSWLSNWLSK